jgi:tRNA (guanine37-N1)-methyltransferase
VLGDPGSLDQDSFTAEFGGFPQFTRPAEYRGMKVPEVLLTGDHRRIREWRMSMSRGRARS